MADQIVSGVAENLINRLASAAFREFGRIYGVMDELERLGKTVDSIKAEILDAEDKQQQNRAIQIWIRRLKDDVLHPADDLLDEFYIQDMRHKIDESHRNKLTQVLLSFFPNKICFRSRMARKIEKIQNKFNDVKKDMIELNLIPKVVVVEHSNNVKRDTSSYVLESDIIGREDDKKKIINLLRQPHGNQNVYVVVIVGIGGMGKTALAKLVYNDGEVKSIFEKSMWVCVSDNFDVKTIVKKMVESLTNSKMNDNLSLQDLQKMLLDNLRGKKYLLVLDDIWNESFEKWAQLRTYLGCGAPDSKVVVTTRSQVVAQRMGVSDPYTLNGLNSTESWSLLKKVITDGDETKGLNQILEPIGMKIAEKCRGVPLAIRTLGGLLQGKSEKKEWIAILQGDFWKLCEDEESIMPVLKRSYQNLSPILRQCFACCSLYPKDWEIEKDELIQLWMAHGYLEFSDEKQTMEDIGNQFVKSFLTKSFFQDAEVHRGNRDIYSFKMHDLIHDLARQVAENDCCYLDSETKRLVGCPMHVMLEGDAIGLLESLDANRVRTLIFDNWFVRNGIEEEFVLISKLKYLRFLKLWNCSIIKLCHLIGNLKHLRYLSLVNCKGVKGIFKSISNIVCLQTFILIGRQEFEFSTKDVLNLINLRYLYIANLSAFREKKTTVEFGKLCLGERYKCLIISKWLSSLTNIVEINLTMCPGVQYLPPMERLPFLKSLVIGNLHELEYIYFEEPRLSEEFFPSMNNLRIYACGILKGWWRIRDGIIYDDNSSQSSHLSFQPCLSYLTITGCPMLTHMPTFPNLDEELVFVDSNMDTLEATLNMVKLNSSIEFPPLSMLKHLEIGGYAVDVKTLPDNWMQNLTSLKHLGFTDLPDQTFQEIEFWFKDTLNYLPSLQKIEICSYDLRALPDWICNLSSVQHVSILSCFLLDSLPDGMLRLAKLHTLEIIDCPLLIKECQTETSATRSKIAHIPNIVLKEYSY